MKSYNLKSFLLLLISTVNAITYSILDGGTQFIYYQGTIQGVFTHNNPNLSSCGDDGTYYFANLTNSSLRIGVNPSWDSNPLFFELEHYGNSWQTTTNKRKRSSLGDLTRHSSVAADLKSYRMAPFPQKDFCVSLGGCTYDAVYNLYFATAWYVCEKAGSACPEFTWWPWYYVSAETVNLNAATVTEVSGVGLTATDGGPFYSVTGDQKSWVSNGTVQNSFDFQAPQNYSIHSGCLDTSTFDWNESTPFTYNVKFTNTSTIGIFTLSAPEGNVTLSFAGSRLDAADEEYEPLDGGNYTAIELAPPLPNNSIPHFTFVNGSAFSWYQYGDGTWGVRAVSGSSRSVLLMCGIMWWVLSGAAWVLLL